MDRATDFHVNFEQVPNSEEIRDVAGAETVWHGLDPAGNEDASGHVVTIRFNFEAYVDVRGLVHAAGKAGTLVPFLAHELGHAYLMYQNRNRLGLIPINKTESNQKAVDWENAARQVEGSGFRAGHHTLDTGAGPPFNYIPPRAKTKERK